jgi:excisionase family DNA binding protein
MSDHLIALTVGSELALFTQAEVLEACRRGREFTKPIERHAASAAEALLDADQLAAILNLPKSCVYERARTGAIPSVRVGKHVRFDRVAVMRALLPTKGSALDAHQAPTV